MTEGLNMQIETITTHPYEGQNPGTSGLRKKVKVFELIRKKYLIFC